MHVISVLRCLVGRREDVPSGCIVRAYRRFAVLEGVGAGVVEREVECVEEDSEDAYEGQGKGRSKEKRPCILSNKVGPKRHPENASERRARRAGRSPDFATSCDCGTELMRGRRAIAVL